VSLAKNDSPCIIYNGTYMSFFREDAILFRLNAINEVLKDSKSNYWKGKCKRGAFSRNAAKYIYPSSTFLISALQLAYYMGFLKWCCWGLIADIKKESNICSRDGD